MVFRGSRGFLAVRLLDESQRWKSAQGGEEAHAARTRLPTAGTLWEIPQTQKHTTPLTRQPWSGQSHGDRKAQRWLQGLGGWAVITNQVQSFWWNVLELCDGNGCTTT